MHGEKCPVCQGEGKIPFGMTAELRECHGCGGKGWVEVRDEEPMVLEGLCKIPLWCEEIPPKPEMEKKLVTNPEDVKIFAAEYTQQDTSKEKLGGE